MYFTDLQAVAILLLIPNWFNACTAAPRNEASGSCATSRSRPSASASRAIAALERTLAVRLLDRNAHGVDLTPYGHAFLKGGVAVFDELKQSMGQIAFLADPSAGDLRIGCTDAGAVALVPAVIDKLSRQYPKVVFHVTIADTASLAAHALPERSIDLAIGATPESVSDGQIHVERLFTDRQVVMAGPQNKWVRRRNISLGDLLKEPWILPPADSIARRYNAEAFRSSGLETPSAQVVSFSYPLCHALLATGRFLTLQPLLMARELLPEVGDGGNREGGISWGCLTTSLLHRRSDMPCPTITSSN